MTIIIANIITAVLSILIVLALGTLNTILIKEALDRDLTFSEIIAENKDTKLSRFFMAIVSLPTAIVLKVLTFKKIDTTSIFNMPKGYFAYIEDEGMFGTFALNMKDYLKISNELQINTEVNDDIEEYIIVKPNTLDGLCSMIDITNKLGLKQINN